MPTLTALVVDAPSSGYLATLFVNLIEDLPNLTLLPFAASAMEAWCASYDTESHFWTEMGIGTPMCAWLDKAIGADDASATAVAPVSDVLVTCLDVLIRAGITQARQIEEKVTALSSLRKSA